MTELLAYIEKLLDLAEMTPSIINKAYLLNTAARLQKLALLYYSTKNM